MLSTRPHPTRVLIVDDSAVARSVLIRMIAGDRRFVVAADVSDAAGALAYLATARVDVILLDLEMPGTDGLTALPALLAAGAGARILIVSSSCADGAAKTLRALSLGAADTLMKPRAGAPTGRFAEMLVEKLARLNEYRGDVPDAATTGRLAMQDFDAIAIGASTGGIHALGAMLDEIPPEFAPPIVVTQHLPTSFTPYFAAQVAVLAKRPCDVATDRLRLRPGRIVVAPGDAHICCVGLPDGGAALRLTTTPVASGCMPSVDPMFESMAAVFGTRLLAIVLSGMGRDGAEGAQRVRERGGTIVVQDRESSVVWGMPGAVAAAGLADAILNPRAIGELVARCRRPS